MTAPRHLWSGDWQQDSSAHAEDLARRRVNTEAPTEPEAPAEPVSRPPRRRPTKNLRRLRERIATVRIWTRRRLRVAALAACLTLLIAGAAYAVISGSSSTNKPRPVATNSGTEPWMGVELANAPIRGALVAKVVPGSPAAKAGIRPGDLITQLDTEPIGASATLVAAISGMQPGDTVDIQLQRGASEYTVQVKLGSHTVGTP